MPFFGDLKEDGDIAIKIQPALVVHIIFFCNDRYLLDFFLGDEGFEQSIKQRVDFRPVGLDRAMNYDQYM